jgi:hypothetical protein
MSLNIFGSSESFRFRLGNVSLEISIGSEFFDGRFSERMTKEVL